MSQVIYGTQFCLGDLSHLTFLEIEMDQLDDYRFPEKHTSVNTAKWNRCVVSLPYVKAEYVVPTHAAKEARPFGFDDSYRPRSPKRCDNRRAAQVRQHRVQSVQMRHARPDISSSTWP